MTDHSATVIDNTFSDNFEYETVSGNIITQIADYFPQFMHLKKINVNYKLCSYGHYDYSNFSEQNFKHDFPRLNWTDMNNASDVDETFGLFHRNVSSCILQHVPFKQTTPRELRLKSKPWINPYIQKMIQYYDRLLRKFHRTHSKETEALFKKFCNPVTNNIRKSKIKYFHVFLHKTRVT